MPGERQIKVTILGDDRSASKALKGVGDSAELAGSKVDKFGEKWGPKLAVAGAGAAALGAKLTQMGDESKIATAQLTTAIENAGGSMDKLGPKIEKVSGHLINLGFDDEAAARAMATLATATQDPTKAIESMGLVADIARAKHISLESAADKLAGAYAGKTKVFKEFGIQVSATATEEEKAAAITELQTRVQGQAAAQADNLTTKLTAFKTKVENVAESVGSTLGPALTIGGTAMAGLGGLSQATGMNLGAMAGKAASLAGPVGLAAAAAVTLGYAFTHMNDKMDLTFNNIAKLSRSSTEDMIGAFTEATIKFTKWGFDGEATFRQLAETSYGSAKRMVDGLESVTNKTDAQKAMLKLFKPILEDVAAANVQAGEDAGVHAEAEDDLTDSMEETKAAADVLKESFDRLVGVHLTALEAAVSHESKGADLQAAIDDGTASLDWNTEAGEKTLGMISALITSTENVSQSMIDESGDTAAATAAFRDHVGQLDAMLAGLGPLPPQLQAIVDRLRAIAGQPDISKTISITTYDTIVRQEVRAASRGMSNSMAIGGPVVRMAAGGPTDPFSGVIPGVGSGDHVPILAEPGEFMIRKSAAQKIGLPALMRMNQMAGGGPVGPGNSAAGSQLVLQINLDGRVLAQTVVDNILVMKRRDPGLLG